MNTAGSAGLLRHPLVATLRRRRWWVAAVVAVAIGAVFRDAIPIVDGCTDNLVKCADVVKIGLFQGMIIALIAIGYTLVYGILQLINFANGDVFMLGSVLTLIGVGIFGLKEGSEPLAVLGAFAVILPITMLITATLNASIERVAYRPLRNAPTLATLISAIGMSFILQNVGQKIIGPSPKSLPKLLSTQDVLVLGEVHIQFSHLFVTAITLPLVIGLAWFVKNTRQGKAMRATAQDREAAGLMGIDVNRTIALTFLLAGALDVDDEVAAWLRRAYEASA